MKDIYRRRDRPASIPIPTLKVVVVMRLTVCFGMASHADRSGESTGT